MALDPQYRINVLNGHLQRLEAERYSQEAHVLALMARSDLDSNEQLRMQVGLARGEIVELGRSIAALEHEVAELVREAANGGKDKPADKPAPTKRTNASR